MRNIKTELGDASGSPGKSSLFFLTSFLSIPGIGLPGDRDGTTGKSTVTFAVSDAPDGP